MYSVENELLHVDRRLLSYVLDCRTRGLRGRVVKVADYKSLAPHRCEFEPY